MRQQQAMAVMMGGSNVFLTGAPGAGKTYILNQFVKRAQRAGKRVAVTASTGIAASHLSGTTIHSWSGLGILDELTREDLQRLGSSDRLVKRYNSTDVLVIDEVSMLHGKRLDMINQLAKVLRGNEAAFGGLQVILVGDLFQLPPVSRGTREFDFAHLSEAWTELNLQICYLTEQHRQNDNNDLLILLEAMRADNFDIAHQEMLGGRLQQIPEEDVVLTRLFAHNVDVDSINRRHLSALPGSSHTFRMQTKGGKAKIEQLAKSLLAPEELELKIDAEVMFVANNFAEGFVNGSRGRVIAFKNGLPLVELLNGRKVEVEPHSWSLVEDGKTRAEIKQLPLRLAWAITIHKSQGMSLDAAEIDLSQAFTPGMGYVALSRVRSLEGLYLRGINNMALTMHPQIHDFDTSLQQRSIDLSGNTDDIADEVIAEKKVSEIVDEELFNKLKVWRQKRAIKDSVPAYIIAHNTTLSAVAANPPKTTQQLLGLPGFGSRKVENYGPDILAIVAEHIADN
jgi:ATP-dependent exoDNAse (exonuclease V) alpha subunit